MGEKWLKSQDTPLVIEKNYSKSMTKYTLQFMGVFGKYNVIAITKSGFNNVGTGDRTLIHSNISS